ncbi:hypothetical protein [Pectobacterium phage PcCB7V]|nr:hypothetical protein [Pectobacterium phage PcCB7V]
MKQVIRSLVEIELDYGHPELEKNLEEVMAEEGQTFEQIRVRAREEVFKGLKELIDDDFSPATPGITHKVEDISE